MGELYTVILLLVLLLFYVHRICILFFGHFNDYSLQISFAKLVLACISSVSVGLGSKERPRNETGTVFCPRKIGARAKIRKRGWILKTCELSSPEHAPAYMMAANAGVIKAIVSF